MRLRDCKLEEFVNLLKNRKMIWFGASEMPGEICQEYIEYHFEEHIEFFVDNSIQKQKEGYDLRGKRFSVVSPSYLAEHFTPEMLVVITSRYYVEIWEQLQGFEQLAETECVVWPMVAPQYKTDSNLKDKIKAIAGKTQQIPKKIHYFWFGNNSLPELESRCIESWGKKCPDYEIVRWDESNYDIHKNKYMQQAYEMKKWGFVPDYARLDVIYTYGGIYLDTDVEVVRNFDELLGLSGFVGFESKRYINMGQGFGAAPGNAAIKKLRDDYNTKEYCLKDGALDLTPSPVYQTEVFKKMGLKMNNQIQQIEDMTVLPAECFSPDNNMIPHITENTYSIHHFSGSWTTDGNQAFLEQQRKFLQKKG